MKFWFQNSPYFPSYVKNWPSYGTKRKDNFNIGPAFTHFYLLKMKLHNPVCLTFCVVTWSIFHVGRKVRWVLKSKFHGLSNGYQKFLCTCSRNRENNKNKVKTDLWDTLYVWRSLFGLIFQESLLDWRIESLFPTILSIKEWYLMISKETPSNIAYMSGMVVLPALCRAARARSWRWRWRGRTGRAPRPPPRPPGTGTRPRPGAAQAAEGRVRAG